MAARRITTPMLAAAALLAAAAVGVAQAAHSARHGALVKGFGHHGVVTLGRGTSLLGVAAEPNGDTVAVGESGAGRHTRMLVARLTPSGRLDGRFGHRGIAAGPLIKAYRGSGSLGRAVAIQRDGKIVVVGKGTSPDGSGRGGLLIVRFDANGRLDRSFGHGGVVNLLASSFGDGYGVAIEPNGDIVATGTADKLGSGGSSFPRLAVVRLRPNGSPDRSFGSHGISVLDVGPYSYGLAVAIDRGRIVVAGSVSPDLRSTDGLIVGLTASGRLDHGFAGRGFAYRQYAQGASYSAFNAIAVRGNGQVVAAGATAASQNRAFALIARFSRSGRPDGGFGSRGVAYVQSATEYLSSNSLTPGAYGVALSRGGDVLAAGLASRGVLASLALWELDSRGRPVRRFGSGGAALLAGGGASGLAVSSRGGVVVAGTGGTARSPRGLLARYAS